MRAKSEMDEAVLDVFALDEEVARLEACLPKEAGTARLAVLVPLAWHLRQRDTRRAMDLADQADILLPHANLPILRQQRLRARLLLLRAEAQWLFAKIDAACALLEQALPIFQETRDLAGIFDAHLLFSKISADRGDTVREDLALLLAQETAQELQDPLRSELAQGSLAYGAVLHDVQTAIRQWHHVYGQEQESGHPLSLACRYDYQGAVASLSGDFGRAATCFIRSHQAAMQSGQVRRALYISNNIGDSFDALNDHQTALNWMLHGLELARHSGWPGCIGACLTQTAQVMRHLGRHDSAQQMLDEAMHTLQDFAGSRNHSIALEYLAELELERGDFRSALERFRYLHEQASKLAQTDFYTTAWRGQAQALSELGFADDALHAANQALQLAVRHQDAYHQVEALRVLAHIHQRHNLPLAEPAQQADSKAMPLAPSAALHFLQQALNIAQQIEGYTIPGDLLDAMADAWAQQGNHEKAYLLARQANSAREKTHGQQATNRAIALQIRQQTEQAQAEGEYHRQLAEAEARRASALQQTTSTLEHLSAIGQEITAHLDRLAVFQALNRHLHQLLDVSSFAVYLLQEDGQMLQRAFGVEAGCALPAGQISLHNPDALSARCLRQRREILADCLPSQQDENVIPGTLASLSALFAPLMVGQRTLGVMTVQSLQRHAYGEREQMIFRTLCAYGAIALDNANAYAQLQQTQQQLVAQEKLAALGSLVAGVAHELNTPIGNSMIMASALQEHVQQVQRDLQAQRLRHAHLQTFVKEAQEASQLILRGLGIAADLVGSFKQVAVDRTTAQYRQFDLQQTSHEIVATLMSRIRPCGHEMTLDIPAGLQMYSYPGPLGQVITNLIDNALMHGFEGRTAGSMHLSARQSQPGYVQLQFRDNGNGIAAPHLRHVFDPFFTSKMGRCSGLGLTISYNIVTSLLQGKISIDSKPEHGTLVYLDLPMYLAQPINLDSASTS